MTSAEACSITRRHLIPVILLIPPTRKNRFQLSKQRPRRIVTASVHKLEIITSKYLSCSGLMASRKICTEPESKALARPRNLRSPSDIWHYRRLGTVLINHPSIHPFLFFPSSLTYSYPKVCSYFTRARLARS